MIRLIVLLASMAIAVAIALPGCYYPYPAYTPVTVSGGGPASFDASWQAARGAAYDEGVRITFEDRATGTLRGDQGPYKVLITVAPQANGSVQVAFSVTGPQSECAGLQDQLTRAYQRRMGR
jgi:hypothetical protein